MIYKLEHDFENAYSLLIDNIELITKMPGFRPRFFATPRAKEWVAPEATLYASKNFEGLEGTFPDLSVWATGLVLFSPAAYKLYHTDLVELGEFLPITITDDTWYLFNTLYVLPEKAMDKSKAIEVVDTGVHLGQANVIFDESYLDSEGVMLFKAPTNKLIYALCTEKFKSCYEQHDFKGLTFTPV